jgi:ABC-type branched-subunit amino acid transport system permease subunit
MTVELERAPRTTPPRPDGRIRREPRVAAMVLGGAGLVVIGAYLPWATFVLNDGPYPEHATLEFFSEPWAVTGFRLHLLGFGLAGIVLALVPVPGRARILRGLGIATAAVSTINGLFITARGGGLGAITVDGGDAAFGAVAALAGGGLLAAGAVVSGVGGRPAPEWRFGVAANLSGAAASKVGIALPFPLVMLVCAVVAGVVGAVVGTPTLRVRGDYLAIVTLAFGEIFVRSAQNDIGGLTGGANAIPGIPPVELLGTMFDSAIAVGPLQLPPGTIYYALIVLVVAVVMLVFANLRSSRLGRAWIAIREDEDAARAMGIRTGRTKIMAFLLGAMLAGFAGAVFAHKTATVSYESFRFLESVTLLAAVILGGTGTIPGAVLGASILFVLPEKLREFSDYRLLLFGIALILIMRIRTQGLVAAARRRGRAPRTREEAT